MILDLNRNILPVELILLNTASIGQSRCVQDANLAKSSGVFSAMQNAGAHQYTIAALKLIKLGRVGLTLTGRTTLFVGVVKGLEVIVIYVLAAKNIGHEFDD